MGSCVLERPVDQPLNRTRWEASSQAAETEQGAGAARLEEGPRCRAGIFAQNRVFYQFRRILFMHVGWCCSCWCRCRTLVVDTCGSGKMNVDSPGICAQLDAQEITRTPRHSFLSCLKQVSAPRRCANLDLEQFFQLFWPAPPVVVLYR